MIPFRLVVDTNIVVSAALKPTNRSYSGAHQTGHALRDGGDPRRILGCAAAPEIRNPEGRPPATPAAHREPFRQAGAISQVTSDPDDNMFLGCADAARGLLGDRQPAAFSEILEENQGDNAAGVHQHRGAASHSMTSGSPQIRVQSFFASE